MTASLEFEDATETRGGYLSIEIMDPHPHPVQFGFDTTHVGIPDSKSKFCSVVSLKIRILKSRILPMDVACVSDEDSAGTGAKATQMRCQDEVLADIIKNMTRVFTEYEGKPCRFAWASWEGTGLQAITNIPAHGCSQGRGASCRNTWASGDEIR